MLVKIELRNLNKFYHDGDQRLTIVESLSYSFPSSGAVAVVGRSGIGKSTLLHLIGGLDRPTGGEVLCDGVSIYQLEDRALTAWRGTKVGFIFQFHHLLHEFSALENVAMPLIINGVGEEEAMARASKMLNRVGLGSRGAHRPGELSGGEQQRVAIARAVVTNPRVVLADEPTGNLDYATAKGVQDLLIDINRELSNVFIIVTHSQDLAKSMDCVVEMLPGGNLRTV